MTAHAVWSVDDSVNISFYFFFMFKPHIVFKISDILERITLYSTILLNFLHVAIGLLHL